MAAKILIVEDNPDQRDFLEVLLRLEGYTIHTATDGGEALKRARAEPPDLIISDIRMPDVDGIELVQRLRAMPGYGRVPILVLSGDGSGDLQVAGKAGANLVLRKPVEVDELIGTIKRMIS
jgi:CheY-like chemotaxis protein